MNKDMVRVYLGLGANIDNPLTTVARVIGYLQSAPPVRFFKASKLYRTSPVGGVEQPDFINAACCFDTDMPLRSLKDFLKGIEGRFNKVVIEKNGPRAIDIDILLYGDLVQKQEVKRQDDLEIPHPRMFERLFVLVPLSDLTDTVALRKDHETITLSLPDLIQELRVQSADRVEAITEEPNND